MLCRSLPRRYPVLFLEALEDRFVLDGDILIIPMDPNFDLIGNQVPTIMAYDDENRASATVFFDSGAGAVIFSAEEQAFFQDRGAGIPIKVKDGAVAAGAGGIIVGDVSAPGTILVEGFTEIEILFDSFGFPLFNIEFGSNTLRTPGIQAFIGTEDGSPILPTITGTPILSPTPQHPRGVAAFVDMFGGVLDLSDLIEDLVVAIPGITFPASGAKPIATAETTPPIYMPVKLFGLDTYADPGDAVTEGFNPLHPDVTAVFDGRSVEHKSFLFDTGAMISTISSEVADGLNLDLNRPDTTLEIQGAAGVQEVPGFVIDKLVLTTLEGGLVVFTDVPVFVLDIAEGIDGILGMNLMNWASTFVYDPFYTEGPRLGFTFLLQRDIGDGDDPFGGYSTGILEELGIFPSDRGGLRPLHLPSDPRVLYLRTVLNHFGSLTGPPFFQEVSLSSFASAPVAAAQLSPAGPQRLQDGDPFTSLQTEQYLLDPSFEDLLLEVATTPKARAGLSLLLSNPDSLDELLSSFQEEELCVPETTNARLF